MGFTFVAFFYDFILLKSNKIFISLPVNLHFTTFCIYLVLTGCVDLSFKGPSLLQPTPDAFLIFRSLVDILLFDRTLSQVPMCV